MSPSTLSHPQSSVLSLSTLSVLKVPVPVHSNPPALLLGGLSLRPEAGEPGGDLPGGDSEGENDEELQEFFKTLVTEIDLVEDRFAGKRWRRGTLVEERLARKLLGRGMGIGWGSREDEGMGWDGDGMGMGWDGDGMGMGWGWDGDGMGMGLSRG